jgi:hypothetical protein
VGPGEEGQCAVASSRYFCHIGACCHHQDRSWTVMCEPTPQFDPFQRLMLALTRHRRVVRLRVEAIFSSQQQPGTDSPVCHRC